MEFRQPMVNAEWLNTGIITDSSGFAALIMAIGAF